MWAELYRPRTLDEVRGQERAKNLIRGALRKRVAERPKSWLISGSWGTAKTTLARIMAQCFSCPTPINGEACQTCQSCQDIRNGHSTNFLEMDAASRTGIDDIRKLIQEVYSAPVGRSPQRTFLLDEAHGLSSAAQDSLLKILENPPPQSQLILVTTEPEKLKSTILSRCTSLQLSLLSTIEIFDFLKYICDQEQLTYEPEALQAIASETGGHARDAVFLMETLSLLGDITLDSLESHLGYSVIEDIFQLFLKSLREPITGLLPEWVSEHLQKYSIDIIWRGLRKVLMDLELYRVNPQALQVSLDKKNVYNELATVYKHRLSDVFSWITQIHKLIPSNSQELTLYLSVLFVQYLNVSENDHQAQQLEQALAALPKRRRSNYRENLIQPVVLTKDQFLSSLNWDSFQTSISGDT